MYWGTNDLIELVSQNWLKLIKKSENSKLKWKQIRFASSILHNNWFNQINNQRNQMYLKKLNINQIK